jgi:FdhD protein
MPNHVLEAVLLCGGDSERLGFAKEMLRVDGVPLAAAMASRLQRLFDALTLVSNHPAYLEHWVNVPIFSDQFPGLGPLAGIHTGLARCEADSAFFLACDMPLVPDELISHVIAEAERSDAQAVVARTPRGPEPLCGVYRRSLLPELTARLEAEEELSAVRFLEDIKAAYVDVGRGGASRFRDVDTPADMGILKGAFDDVEPLPVRRCGVTRIGGRPLESDVVVNERPFALRVNGVHLVTILCLPIALRELMVGFLAYMGLITKYAEVYSMAVDYDAGRMSVEVDADESSLHNAVRLQISSTCGAGVYGPPLPQLMPGADRNGFQVGAEHILRIMRKLRSMAPVFAVTGATHQAAFTDGRNVVHFFEDVGRHNAIDKVTGRGLMDGTDMTRGVLLATGRLNAEMVVKALRHGVSVVGTRSAVTAGALEIAEAHGMTLVGFARGRRLNVYTAPERVAPG